MAWFRWVSLRPLPAAWDLRGCGWRLIGNDGATGETVLRLIDASTADAAPERLAPALRSRSLVMGLADSGARARWLALGYADALPSDVALAELGQRATRVIDRPNAARRRVGRLLLDLLTRDARVEGRRLRLHPREFALLWRLSELPGAPVTRRTLLRDVFDLSFDPGTNRLAVHVCRLRKKLALVGLASLLATASGEGGYRLIVSDGSFGPWEKRGDPVQRIPQDPQFPLDHALRLGEHAPSIQEFVR